jgi:FixJ family two-component response regulator
VRKALRRLVASLSYQTSDFASGEDFLESLSNEVPSCALIDLHMPGLSGIDVLKRLQTIEPALPAVIVTANTAPAMRAHCASLGAVGYLLKPVDSEALSLMLRDAVPT